MHIGHIMLAVQKSCMLRNRFDGDLQYNDNNRQQNGFVLGPPLDFADSDVESPGAATEYLLSFLHCKLAQLLLKY